ncbi:MAG: AAA family ATPase [Methanoregula sp.]|nr:AAA family ATPase [Methanoregula sp.]
MTIITFSHHKGGTGKTTSCLNIAGFCQQAGRKVLVIDCDPQANATAGLGIDPSTSGNNMYEVFMSGIDGFPKVMIQDIIKKTASGIDLAPAHLDMVGAEPYLYHASFPTGVLKEAVTNIKNQYSYIFIDTPPSVGQFVINGLFAADHVIVTLDSGLFALNGVTTLSTIFSDIKNNLGKDINPDMAIVSRWGEGLFQSCSQPEAHEKTDIFTMLRNIFYKPPEPSPENLKAEEEHKNEQTRLLVTLNEIKHRFPRVYTVPYSSAVYEAQKRGMPISHFAPGSSAGIAYKTIAEEVMRWN